MLLRRSKLWLTIGAMVALGSMSAQAQVPDMQYFAPANPGTFGGGARANEGFFISGEYLRWSISKPDAASVGVAPPASRTVYYDTDVFREQTSTADNTWIGSRFTDGSRVEAGFMEDHQGLMFSGFFMSTYGRVQKLPNADMVFDDPEFGPPPFRRLLQGFVDDALTDIQNLPVTFTAPVVLDDNDNPLPTWGLVMDNVVKTWNTELNYVYRFHPTRHGTFWEIYLGVRYFEFNEEFNVDAFGGILADSFWYTRATNHVVGPQAGIRFFRTFDRWTFESTAKFFAGFNFQNYNQYGVLGSQLDPLAGPQEDVPLYMGPTSFTNSATEEEWSPSAELRVAIKYNVTRSMALSVGWTGMWMDGIGRASNAVVYRVPNMGITLDRNNQDLFINGVTAGVEFNR